MKLDGQRRSTNVEDRRGGRSPGRTAARAGVPIGCGTVLIGAVLIGLGADPVQVLSLFLDGNNAPMSQPSPRSGPPSAGEDALADFASRVLADTEDTWAVLFRDAGSTYRPPNLVLFTDSVRSACGMAGAAVGPFYCPGDQKVYIDLSFFDTLYRRLGAPGDFAQAYVLAHEVGHHIQTLTGTSAEVRRAQAGLRETDANALSVKLELQADCYAGVWGHYANQKGLLSQGDLQEGLRAAHAIGDDTLQRNARGYVAPDSFTHGTSEQRAEWLLRGFRSGDPQQCDTFR